jgi:hypothetical protein
MPTQRLSGKDRLSTGDRVQRILVAERQAKVASDNLDVTQMPQLGHFLDSARRGRDSGAHADRAAYKIATCLTDYLNNLDSDSIAGLHDFMRLQVAQPDKALQLIQL